MSTATTVANSYDELPYPSQPLAQTDPDRLASIAMLFGLQPRPAAKCRVIELGCATGGNLIPLAERNPDSQYLGIDYSQRQIAVARATADELGLKNIEFLDRSILDLDAGIGAFDYILCHGVYSWVSQEIQGKILDLCRNQLHPQGVAYLSYNVYPGWHCRAMLRQIAGEASSTSASAAERVERATRALRFVSGALADDEAPYARLLREEIEMLLRQPPTYLFHEYLEDENHPVYFHEFVERIGRHGLQYLGDATPSMMFASNFGPDVAQDLLDISTDVVSVEQHMDFLRNRGFRQSVICHAGVALDRFVEPRQLQGVYLAGQLRPANESLNLEDGVVESFLTGLPNANSSGAGTISSPSPAFKAAMLCLGTVWPAGIAYPQLLNDVSARLAQHSGTSLTSEDADNLGHNIVQCIATGLIDIASQPDSFVTHLSARPRASRLARWQAATAAAATNRKHGNVPLDQMSQQILQRLDGEHDRKSLLQSLVEGVDRGDLTILINGVPATRGTTILPTLEHSLDDCLARLATQALLIG